jgi:hypothetical protein
MSQQGTIVLTKFENLINDVKCRIYNEQIDDPSQVLGKYDERVI